MIVSTSVHSPVLLANLLSNYNITLDENDEADICFSFSYKKTKSRLTVLFNSYEYCFKRELVILDNPNITVVSNTISEMLNV